MFSQSLLGRLHQQDCHICYQNSGLPQHVALWDLHEWTVDIHYELLLHILSLNYKSACLLSVLDYTLAAILAQTRYHKIGIISKNKHPMNSAFLNVAATSPVSISNCKQALDTGQNLGLLVKHIQELALMDSLVPSALCLHAFISIP